MDTKTKQKLAESVRKDFSRQVVHSGFVRTKTTFWTRRDEFVAQFVHLHLFSYSPSFRVHLGVRVLSSTFSAAALNGLSSHDGWAFDKRKYVFDFSESPESTSRCAAELAAFVSDVALPWFLRFNSPETLLEPGSPLDDDDKRSLELALAGQHDHVAVATSHALLGLSA